MLGIKRITGAADLAAEGQPESWVMPAVKSSGGNSSAAPGNPSSRQAVNVFALAGIGTMNAICILAGTGLGWLAGRQLGTNPAFLLTGMVLGIACGAFGTYKQVRKYLKD